MANVKNNHVAPLGVGGVVIAPGRTAAVPAWDRVKNGHAVKIWQEMKLLEVTDAQANDTPAPTGLPALPGTGAQLPPASVDEDAQKEAIIAELRTLGVEKTKRSSLENLKADLETARAK